MTDRLLDGNNLDEELEWLKNDNTCFDDPKGACFNCMGPCTHDLALRLIEEIAEEHLRLRNNVADTVGYISAKREAFCYRVGEAARKIVEAMR